MFGGDRVFGRRFIHATVPGEGTPIAEATPGGPARRRRDGARDDREPVALASKAGHGLEQAARVGMAWIAEQLPHGCALDDLATVHHQHARCHLGHHTQVVRDEQDREPEALLQVGEQLEDLRLDGDVERGGGLVGDEERRVHHQRHRDEHALAHAA